MKCFIGLLVCILLPLFALAFAAGMDQKPCSDQVSYNEGEKKAFLMEVSDIETAGVELARLYDGEIIIKMVPGEKGYQAGYMRFVVESDPVTVWQVVNSERDYALEDGEFSLRKGKRTFWPYVRATGVCRDKEKGDFVFQLSEMPLGAPRLSINSVCVNRAGFPWEKTWKEAEESPCGVNVPPESAELLKRSVRAGGSSGTWRVSPLPEKMRKAARDAYRTDLIYLVKVQPAGLSGVSRELVNYSQKTSLKKIAELVRLHAERWEGHLKKFHPEDLPSWTAERKKYEASLKARFPKK